MKLVDVERPKRKVSPLQCPVCQSGMEVIPEVGVTLVLCTKCDFGYEVPVIDPKTYTNNVTVGDDYDEDGEDIGTAPNDDSEEPPQSPANDSEDDNPSDDIPSDENDVEGDSSDSEDSTDLESEDDSGMGGDDVTTVDTSFGDDSEDEDEDEENQDDTDSVPLSLPIDLVEHSSYDDSPERREEIEKLLQDAIPYEPDPQSTEELKAKAFYRAIASTLSDNAFDRRVGGKKNGRFNSKDSYKLTSGNHKVFSQKEQRQGKHYNIVICVDRSGSMASLMNQGYGPDERIEVAARSARLLVNGLTKLGVDFAVLGFNEQTRVFKDWIAPRFNVDKMVTQLCSGIRSHDYTHTFQALRTCEEMLDKAPHDGENIIIFITDGQGQRGEMVTNERLTAIAGEHVATDTGTGITVYSQRYGWVEYGTEKPVNLYDATCLRSAFTQHVKRIGRKASIVPIGIELPCLTDWFPNGHVVNTTEEFMTTLLTDLRKVITKH